MRDTLAIQDQNLFDLAIQKYGNVEAVVEMARLNDRSITDVLAPGLKIVSSYEVLDKQVYDYYTNRSIKPTTGELGIIPCLYRGIGYMIVETDFIVGLKCPGEGEYEGIGFDILEFDFLSHET